MASVSDGKQEKHHECGKWLKAVEIARRRFEICSASASDAYASIDHFLRLSTRIEQGYKL